MSGGCYCENCGRDNIHPTGRVRIISREFGAEDYCIECYQIAVGDALDGFCDDFFRIQMNWSFVHAAA